MAARNPSSSDLALTMVSARKTCRIQAVWSENPGPGPFIPADRHVRRPPRPKYRTKVRGSNLALRSVRIAAVVSGSVRCTKESLCVPAVLLTAGVGRRAQPCAGANRLHPLLRQEPDPLRQLRLAHLPDRALRDLLLPGDRAAPRTHRRLRRERVSARQLRAEARPLDEAAADPVLDRQRVLAAERDSRRRRRKASARLPNRAAIAS